MFLGCDPEAVREHARLCDDRAATVHDLLTRLGATATAVQWTGPDADAFRQRVHAAVQQGGTTTGRLQTLAAQLTGEADEQDETSQPDGLLPGDIGLGDPNDFPFPFPTGLPTEIPGDDKTPPPLPADTQRELDELLRRASDSNDLFGNRGDVEALTKKLASMTPEERASYVASLSDEELRALDAALGKDGGGIFGVGGLDDGTRRALLDQLLRNADPDDVRRLADAFGALNPDPRGGGDSAQNKYDVNPNGTISPTGPVVPPNASWRDVAQGDYGDCVSMATLGMMMKDNPNWAAEHVVDNGNGTVTVTLYDENGNPDPITMPKELPATNGSPNSASRDPLNADPNAPTWPAYVERALAMQMGKGYPGIEGHGSPEVGPRLTGMQVQTLPPNDPDAAFAAAAAGKPMIVGTAVPTDGKPTPPAGWVGHHGFWVEGLGKNAAGEEVIILRNPHGPNSPTVELTREQYRQFTSSAEVHQ